MGLAVDVLLGGMLDSFVGISQFGKPIVGMEFVGVDDGAGSRGDMLLDDGEQSGGPNVGSDGGNGPLGVSLNNSHCDGLACRAPATLTRPLAADVGFVHFNGSKREGGML